MTPPVYQQLAELLLGQISTGEIAVGDRLPTEEQLCGVHGLSRGTVRQALARLTSLGMIHRQAGVGTVVVAGAPLADYQPVAQSSADIAAIAAGTRLVTPQTREVVADAALAKRLGTRSGTRWTLLEGARARRGSDDPPVCWSEHYLRGDLPATRMLRGGPLPADLDGQEVEQIIAAALLEPAVADALGAEPASAALVITRRHRDRRGRLASVGIHTHPADRYVISMSFGRRPDNAHHGTP